MIKLTVLYGHPTGHERSELTKFISAPDGGHLAYYRMAEFWFTNTEALQATMGSPEGQATAGDLANFATGGVSFMVGAVEE